MSGVTAVDGSLLVPGAFRPVDEPGTGPFTPGMFRSDDGVTWTEVPLDPAVFDMTDSYLGPVIDLIRAILDIADDIQEWISDLLNVSFGLLDFVLQVVADYFAKASPIHEIEDPFPMLDEATNPNPSGPAKLIPVKVPIRDLKVFNNDVEMVLEGNVG